VGLVTEPMNNQAAAVEPAPLCESSNGVVVTIYVMQHCANCLYAYETATYIRRHYPQVEVRLVDLETTNEAIPENVFATPTYLLNGRLWSLGNPSLAYVDESLRNGKGVGSEE
jgi:hypothetical protein